MKVRYSIEARAKIALCATHEEAAILIAQAEKAGRGDDIIHIAQGGKYKINILDLYRQLYRADFIGTFLTRGVPAAKEAHDDLTEAAVRISNLIQLYTLSGSEIDFCKISESLESTKRYAELYAKAEIETKGDPEAEVSLFFVKINEMQWNSISMVTRQRILSVLKPLFNILCTQEFAELFDGESNFTLEDLQAGKIIIVDLPASGKELDLARVAGQLIKTVVQVI